MGKRFTATEKWMDSWFRGLAPEHKLAWLYVLDNCDHAGVIEIDRELAEFQIGAAVGWEEFFDRCGDRLIGLAKGKHWVSKFIEFQYGTPSEDCKAHKPIFTSLTKHQISQRVSKGYPEGINTLKDKEKDKEKDKDKEKEGGVGETKRRFVAPTAEDVEAYCLDHPPSIDANQFVNFYASKGWRVGSQPMKDWRAAVRTWQTRANQSAAIPI